MWQSLQIAENKELIKKILRFIDIFGLSLNKLCAKCELFKVKNNESELCKNGTFKKRL